MSAGPAVASVVRAEPGDAAELSALVATAFRDLPPSVWLVGQQDAREALFPGYFRLYVDLALATGTVYTTPDRTAVALWFPYGEHGHAGVEQDAAEYDARLAAVTGGRVDRFRAFDAQLERHHPRGEPHDHLAVLAVRPELQGRGIGSALLDAHHRELGRRAAPAAAYLEAASIDSRRLYVRHGYRDLPDPIPFPDGIPATAMMYPMWRPPMGEP
ncbi:GNAT family N-acetyltransferase [Actinocrinis puniceicyclus]|uniref:GNAT family N-acetyltransferase n=1 Tax=Actinocrinis puniceicyclus TaxID=977794 RepID=A0A8J7WNM8_9ACTN|nr:GNAT family N-acetyltransferase [Actinocrinis puniceicyclus]MBS2963032.1 GNAT family N-acetyltransferase [Actinocrinis puniceicyclus]